MVNTATKVSGASGLVETRRAEWGNWAIILYTIAESANGTKDYSTLKVHHKIEFPCGAQGPCDGFYGSPQREGYKRIIREWAQHGILPV